MAILVLSGFKKSHHKQQNDNNANKLKNKRHKYKDVLHSRPNALRLTIRYLYANLSIEELVIVVNNAPRGPICITTTVQQKHSLMQNWLILTYFSTIIQRRFLEQLDAIIDRKGLDGNCFADFFIHFLRYSSSMLSSSSPIYPL